MSRIRTAIEEIENLDIPHQRFFEVVVGRRDTELFVRVEKAVIHAAPGRQQAFTEMLDPIAPYAKGPHLLRPREHLRILPGKLHGEPHLVDTRITSASVYGLQQAGYGFDLIKEMFPEATDEALHDAVDLEQSLNQLAA